MFEISEFAPAWIRCFFEWVSATSWYHGSICTTLYHLVFMVGANGAELARSCRVFSALLWFFPAFLRWRTSMDAWVHFRRGAGALARIQRRHIVWSSLQASKAPLWRGCVVMSVLCHGFVPYSVLQCICRHFFSLMRRVWGCFLDLGSRSIAIAIIFILLWHGWVQTCSKSVLWGLNGVGLGHGLSSSLCCERCREAVRRIARPR